MSQENVEVVRRETYEAFKPKRDLDDKHRESPLMSKVMVRDKP